MSVVDFTLARFLLFTLILFRIGGLLLTAPLLGSRTLPTQLKIGLAMLIALLVLPLLEPSTLNLPYNLPAYLLAVVGETAIGMILGFAASFLFAAVQLAGMLIDQELGMSLANVIDPVNNEQVSIVGQFKLLLASSLFLALDAHHMLLKAVADSFRTVPVMGFRFTDTLALKIGDELAADLFSIAVRLAAPTVVTMLLTTIALGFLARAVPEMNIFIVGFSIRLLIGFAVLVLGIGVFSGVFSGLTDEMGAFLPRLISAMK